jgi:hypothetical protein
MSLRRVAVIGVVLLLALGGIDFRSLAVPLLDRSAIAAEMAREPDRGIWWPDYPRFLQAVRERTGPGDIIAVVVPATRWDYGYAYAYYRASYFLAGREVLPVVGRDDRFLPENLGAARYIAAWHRPLPPGAQVVLRAAGGALVERP